ncbi:MAG: type II secretion system F family protein [Phycisphaerae bacterium]
MQTFKYELRTQGGQTTSGTIQAASMGEATARLRPQGYVQNIQPVQSGAAGILAKMQSVSVEKGPGLKDVHNFTKQLAVMIKAGISIRNAIDGIADQVENKKFQKIIRQLKDDVESGQPFSDSLAKHPKLFSPLYVNMVRASELSGNLGHMLQRIATNLDQQIETRSMVRGAMIYPAIILTMAVSAVIFLLVGVLPTFENLFAGKEEALPKPTMMLLTLSDFLRTKWYLCIGSIVIGGGGFLYFIRTPSGRIIWDKIKLKVPLFKNMFNALYITRGLQTMGELVSAGVPMLETLKITSDVSGNAVWERMWSKVHASVKQGNKIADPLMAEDRMPKNVVQMIAAGEQSGNLGDVMQEIADFYGKELRATIKAVTAMIEPIMMVVMGVVVGFIAMSIVLPIFKMSSLVK